MEKKYETAKLRPETLRRLRMIAATTGETMLEVMERLTADELEQLQKEEEKGAKDANDGK